MSRDKPVELTGLEYCRKIPQFKPAAAGTRQGGGHPLPGFVLLFNYSTPLFHNLNPDIFFTAFSILDMAGYL